MWRYLLIATFSAVLTGTAMAQSPPSYDWTGIYIGGNGGYGWGIDDDVDIDYFGTLLLICTLTPPGTCPTSASLDSEGFVIGGHAGANWQSGHLVFGIEGDADFSDINGNVSATVPVFVATFSERSELNWLSTLRGRVGIAANRVLLYGTGGLAFGDVESRTTITQPPAAVFSDSDDGIEFGWAAGGGGELAVSDHVIFGVEALVVDLGDSTNVLDFGGGDRIRTEFDNAYVVARGRVSVKW